MFISEGTNYSKDIMGSNLSLRLTDRPHFHLQNKIQHVTKYQNGYVRKMLNGLSEDAWQN
jgi:hypothetical protein